MRHRWGELLLLEEKAGKTRSTDPKVCTRLVYPIGGPSKGYKSHLLHAELQYLSELDELALQSIGETAGKFNRRAVSRAVVLWWHTVFWGK